MLAKIINTLYLNNKNKIYRVILEGVENNCGYFITFTIASYSKNDATDIAFSKSVEMKLNIVRVEEVEIIKNSPNKIEKILNISGKIYFDLEKQ